MDLAPTQLTTKSCNLKSQVVVLVAAQLDLRAWFSKPCLDFCSLDAELGFLICAISLK